MGSWFLIYISLSVFAKEPSVGFLSQLTSLDPAEARDSATWQILGLIHETLYQIKYQSTPLEYVPLLAVDVPSVSNDGKTFTIQIKENIYFHSDPVFSSRRKLVAEDFIYGLKRLALPGVPNQHTLWLLDVIEGYEEFYQALQKSDRNDLPNRFRASLPGLLARDERTLVIRTKIALSEQEMKALLSLPFTAPIAHEVIKKYASYSGLVPSIALGTGPYRLSHWKRGKEILLTRNPTFHVETTPSGRPIPRREGLRFIFFRELKNIQLSYAKKTLNAYWIPGYFLLGTTNNPLFHLKDHFDVLSIPFDGTFLKEIIDQTTQTASKNPHSILVLGTDPQIETAISKFKLEKSKIKYTDDLDLFLHSSSSFDYMIFSWHPELQHSKSLDVFKKQFKIKHIQILQYLPEQFATTLKDFLPLDSPINWNRWKYF